MFHLVGGIPDGQRFLMITEGGGAEDTSAPYEITAQIGEGGMGEVYASGALSVTPDASDVPRLVPKLMS